MDLANSELVSSDLPRATSSSAAMSAAVDSVTGFSAEVFAALAASLEGNVVCSPYSVAVALGMTVQGARGTTAAQILAVLHSDDATALVDGLNGIDLALAARSGEVNTGEGKPGHIVVASANSLWGQRDTAWEKLFLDVLARDFGTGMRVVDYLEDAEGARRAVNAWVSQQTRTRIPELIAPDILNQDTRLTLVNAIYFKAPWQEPFEKSATREAPFHRLDGSTVTTDLMQGPTGKRFASGPGWVAADLPYARGELAMAVIVPDSGRFAEVQEAITGEWLAGVLTDLQPEPVRVGLPRWTSRTQAPLDRTLENLGMPLAFTDGADFSGMTTQEKLLIGAAVHEGFIAVDEDGTEAAAATAVVVRAVSAPAVPPRSVIADRPFLYVIHDLPTRTPLFVGRVLDPTAT